MDLVTRFEPLIIIHLDWTSDNFDNEYDNQWKTNIQTLSAEDDVNEKVGFAVIMKSHLVSKKGLFLSYIGQQDILIPELSKVDFSQFKQLVQISKQEYEQAFFEKIGQDYKEKLGFEYPIPDQASMQILYDELLNLLP